MERSEVDARAPRRGPSEATQRRRDTKMLLAPFVANLAAWHQQAARLMLEVERAEARGEPKSAPATAVQQLIDTVRNERDAFLSKTAALASSRVEDVAKSFRRLLADLEHTRERCRIQG